MKKDKIKKTIIIFITILVFFICLSFIQGSYAKYLTTTRGKSDIPIAKWHITVNDNDITNNIETDTIITPVFSGNDYMAPNIIAPNSKGYFDIAIDASNTDVAFKYIIDAKPSEDSPVQDLIVESYQINDNEVIPVTKENQIIDNKVLYNDSNKIFNIRVNIIWDDSIDATMDNVADTDTTKVLDAKATMDVKLSFIQLAN